MMESSKVPQLRNFLWCFSLVSGAKAIGIMKVVIQLVIAITLFILYAVSIGDMHVSSLQATMLGPTVVFICGLSFIEAYFGVLLLQGVFKRKPAYVKIWVVIQFSILIQNLASLIVLTIISAVSAHLYSGRFDYLHILYMGATIGVDIYCTLVVYSYYRDEYYRDRSGNIISGDVIDILIQ